MKISGFTMAKNANKLYFPWKEAIESILPIVDEFVIAMGNSDEDDISRELIESIGSPKIKIIDTVWDIEKYPRGMENAHQTDIAKNHCTGDWLFYLQADEVIHEKYLPIIKENCEKYLHEPKVEGFLFKYKHFWGDYKHYHNSHRWYKDEIRIVRNSPEIHSWESAQSFRRIPNFDDLNYRQQIGTYMLNVIQLDAYVFHYGWVRPPEIMKNKMKALNTIHKGEKKANEMDTQNVNFDYGPLNRLETYSDSHPKVMNEWISKFNWSKELQYNGVPSKLRKKHKHEQLRYRIVSFVENKLFFGKVHWGFKNYNLIKF